MTDVEDIIKRKEYAELSPGELESVKELVQNEEEYNEMKWFLSNAGEAFTGEKIDASPELKKRVMAHLTDSHKRRGTWMNSVTIFLFPTDKKFFQQPAFQLSVAASLVFGMLFFVQNPFEQKSEMAKNEDVKVERPVDTRGTNPGNKLTESEEPAGDQEGFQNQLSPEEGNAEVDNLQSTINGSGDITTVEDGELESSNEMTFGRSAFDDGAGAKSEELKSEVVSDDLATGEDRWKSGEGNNTKTLSRSTDISRSDNTAVLEEKEKTVAGSTIAAGLTRESSKKRDNVEADNNEDQRNQDLEQIVLADETAPVQVTESRQEKSGYLNKESYKNQKDVANERGPDNRKSADPGKKISVDNDLQDIPASAAEEDLKGKEKIAPKALHIQETPELKGLFYTVK